MEYQLTHQVLTPTSFPGWVLRSQPSCPPGTQDMLGSPSSVAALSPWKGPGHREGQLAHVPMVSWGRAQWQLSPGTPGPGADSTNMSAGSSWRLSWQEET